MKPFLAIVVILMLLSLSTGGETSDNHASRSATALRDRLLGPNRATTCQGTSGGCSHHNDCCWWLCCDRRISGCVVSTMRCKLRVTWRSSDMLVHPHLQQPAARSN
nr:conotoxin precursor I3 [Conus judaeus]